MIRDPRQGHRQQQDSNIPSYPHLRAHRGYSYWTIASELRCGHAVVQRVLSA
jgi:hypothetical protein